MTDSAITLHKDGGVTFTGPDAIELYRAHHIKTGIAGWIKFKMIPTRGATLTKMLAMATTYTGKKYTTKRAAEAVADLDAWLSTMCAALPIEDERGS